jgi:predicted transposase/invertase (TIGR01784 family)
MEKGREEGKLEIAATLLARGLSLEDISKITGIPLETLEDKLLEPTP